MKNHIKGLSTFIMLFSFNILNAQTHAKNLHKTVTHVKASPAKVEGIEKTTRAVTTFNQVSQENTMSPTPTDEDKAKYGIYAGRVIIFKQYFSESLPRAQFNGFDDGIHLSSNDWKQWKQDDLEKLATTFNGVDMFADLMDLKNGAAEKDKDGNPTKDAICARNALEELKPNCCKDWKAFAKMIVRAEDATMDQLIKLMKKKNLVIPPGYGALIDLQKNDNIAGDRMQDPTFNQQAALAMLEKSGVTKDATDGLKKPLETAVTDAVKGIKSSVTLAA